MKEKKSLRVGSTFLSLILGGEFPVLDISLHSLSCICFLNQNIHSCISHAALYLFFFKLLCAPFSDSVAFDVHWTGPSLLFACHLFPQIRQTIKRLHWQRFPMQTLSWMQSISPIHPNRPALLRCYINRATLPSTPPWLPWAPQRQEIDVNKEFCPTFPSTSSRPTLKNTGTSTEGPSEPLTATLSCITLEQPSLTL